MRTPGDGPARRLPGILAAVGAACGALAAAGVTLALLPPAPGRPGYYALVAGGSMPRLAAIATLGCLLAAPAALRSRPPRRLPWLALGLCALSAGLSGALTGAVARAGLSQGLSISLADSLLGADAPLPLRLFGADAPRTQAPEVVTFVTGDSAGGHLDADLYRPPGAPLRDRLRPAVVVVHGGAWRWGDKGENAALSHWLARRGYLVLDIQYRLAPAASWQEAVGDIWRAVVWLRAHAPALGVDPDRVALLGRSAGGHLALLAAYTAQAEQRPPWRVIAFYAPVDLGRLYARASGGQAADLRDGLQASLGGDPSARSEAYRAASPIEHVHAGAPPTLLIHGAWDEVVPAEHSQLLADALEGAGVPVQAVFVPFARHAFDLVPDGLPWQLAASAVAGFLDAGGQ